MLKPIIAGLSAVMLTVGAGVISTAAAAETNKPVHDEDGVRIFSKVPPPGVHPRGMTLRVSGPPGCPPSLPPTPRFLNFFTRSSSEIFLFSPASSSTILDL